MEFKFSTQEVGVVLQALAAYSGNIQVLGQRIATEANAQSQPVPPPPPTEAPVE